MQVMMRNFLIFAWGSSLMWLAWNSNGGGTIVGNSGVVSANLVVPSYNKSFTSMPALFGADWPSTPIFARLQLIPNRPLLCEEEHNDNNEGTTPNTRRGGGGGEYVYGVREGGGHNKHDKRFAPNHNNRRQLHNHHHHQEKHPGNNNHHDQEWSPRNSPSSSGTTINTNSLRSGSRTSNSDDVNQVDNIILNSEYQLHHQSRNEQEQNPSPSDASKGNLTATTTLMEEEADAAAEQNTTLLDEDSQLPVAVLVQRGRCTFHEKAEMAAQYYPTVQYVVVYDNEISNNLATMSSQTPLQPPATELALTFISYRSGMELRNLILEQDRLESYHPPQSITGTSGTNTMRNNSNNDNNRGEIVDLFSENGGGLIIQLDGSMSSPQIDSSETISIMGYIIAALTGFLAFLIFFVCVLICAQFGWISARPDERGRLVLFAGAGIRAAGNGDLSTTITALRLMADGLLTEEQVLKHIPEATFEASGITSDDEEEEEEDDGGSDHDDDDNQESEREEGEGEEDEGTEAKTNNFQVSNETSTSADFTVMETPPPSPMEEEITDDSSTISLSSEAEKGACHNHNKGNSDENHLGSDNDTHSHSSHHRQKCAQQSSCAICLDDFDDGEKIRVLPCQHHFHGECVIPWLTERHSSCPLCKFDILEYVLAKIEASGDNDDDDDINHDKPSTSSSLPNSGDEEPPSELVSSPVSSPTSSSPSWWGSSSRWFGGWTLVSNMENDDDHDAEESEVTPIPPSQEQENNDGSPMMDPNDNRAGSNNHEQNDEGITQLDLVEIAIAESENGFVNGQEAL